jgi:hypothetical protein
LRFKIKKKVNISKNNTKGILITKRLSKSGEENRQPMVKDKKIQILLLSIIY